jgi:hypothetical protein
MIQRFDTNLATPQNEFCRQICAVLEGKCAQELLEAFRFLVIWRNHFESTLGELHAISHLSNPDDPPDVIAHFATTDIPIEITSIEPPHVHQSDDLHGKVGNGGGRSEIPVSMKPANMQQALDWMYLPGGGPWENVDDRNKTREESIFSRLSSKLGKSFTSSVSPGVILLTGSIDGSFGEEHAVREAFSCIRRQHSEAKDWSLAICHQWNDIHYFSALDSSQAGFEIRSSIT